MSDPKIPDLPSDEELGIAGFEEELAREAATTRARKGGGGDAGGPEKPPPPPKRPAAGPSPLRPWRGPVTLLVLLALGWWARPERTLPTAAPLDAADSAFASARAMLDLVEIAREPHPTGSPEHARVREVLAERLREMGLQPEIQTATSLVRRGDEVVAATVRNVLARLPGTASTGAIVLTAHYDGRGPSRAAGDDGSGVAAILETVRALKAGPPLANDVLVVLSDGEELGLLGARAFVDGHPWMADVALVLSLEMRGTGGPSIMFQTGAENGWVVRALGQGAPSPVANSLTYDVYRRMPNDTDFTPFLQAGVQGLNFAGIGGADAYHQAYDTPERLDERTLQDQGEHLLGMVREMGSRDLGEVDGPERAYVSLPGLGLVSYPALAGWGVALALVAAFGVAGLLVARAGGLGGAAAGLVLAAVGIGGSAGAGWLLVRLVEARHPEAGALHGSLFHSEGWYVAGLAAAALALVGLLLALARRRFGLGALALGASVIPVVGAVVLAFVAPLGALNLQWPALALTLAAILTAWVGPGRRPGMGAWLGLLVLGAVTVAFVVPLAELVWLALSLRAAPVVGGLLGLGAVLLLPQLDALREPGGGWAPLLALALAVALGGVGVLHARPTALRPAPSTLVYALDRDAGTALWASRDDGGMGWARARVGELGSLQPLTGYGLGEGTWSTGRAPLADAPPPEVIAVADTTLTGRHRVSLAVRSAVGAERVTVELPAGADAYLRAVNGVEVPAPQPGQRDGAGRIARVTHWGEPAGEDGLTLELDVGGGPDTLEITVLEHHLRPGELVGERAFLRPPSLAPNIVNLSDRAVLRTGVRVPLAGGPGAVAPVAVPAGPAPGPADTVPADPVPPDTITPGR